MVRYAAHRGRDDADELVADVPDATVVTSEGALRHDLETARCTVVGASVYLARPDASAS